MQFSQTFLLLVVAIAASASVPSASAFVVVPSTASLTTRQQQQTQFASSASTTLLNMSEDEEEEEVYVKPENPGGRPDFSFSFEIPKKGIADVGSAEVNLPPLLVNSEIVVVRYELPFGLNAEPDPNYEGGVQVIVTKDGAKADGSGEKVGDILRQTTYWRGKNPGLFDVSKNADNFELVVQALVTNDLMVADEIVLVFERPL